MFEDEKLYVNDKLFDLYSHLKINMKTSSPFCEIHESKYTHYCINCKRPVCEVCKDSFHINHIMQEKKLINFEKKKVEYFYPRVVVILDLLMTKLI